MSDLTKARASVWRYFSKYIKLRDCLLTTKTKEAGRCISCGKTIPLKGSVAGHFVHGDNMDFVEENISLQCVHCNNFLHGNLGNYAVNLDKKYGQGTAEKLLAMKFIPAKFTKFDFEQLKEIYKKKYKELLKEE